MAVKYVSDFTFPPSPARPDPVRGYAKGGHVKGASTPMCYAKGGATTPFTYKNGGLAAGRGITNDAGHTGKNGLDRIVARAQGDGPVKYHAKGGAVNVMKNKGVTNDSGHTSKLGVDNVKRSGAGDGDVKRTALSDRKSPSATRYEKVDRGGKTDKNVGSGTVVKKAKGGSIIKLKPANGKIAVKDSGAVNPSDASSPGSYKKNAPSQSGTNKSVAKSKFAGVNAQPESTGDGNKERMAGWSDFKKGGKVSATRIMRKDTGGRKDATTSQPGKKPHGGNPVQSATRGEKFDKGGSKDSTVKMSGRLANLGKYAHGGKVSKDIGTQYEKAAGTPKASKDGSHSEVSSGTAKMAMGGLSRGTSHKKNAAIHAKSHKPHGPSAGALSKIAGALGGAGPMGPPPQMGGPPPDAAPPGGPMAGAGGPPMGAPQGGPPMMAAGGSAKHVFVHHLHVSQKR